MKRGIIVLGLFLASFSLVAQQYKAVLPYRIVGGKMIVDMTINGLQRSFVFDTGAARTVLTDELCRELNLSVIDSMEVVDVNSKLASYSLVMVESLKTLDGKINFINVPAMKLSGPSPFECFQADGLIGSELLSQLIVEIDSKAQAITLMSGEKASNVSLRKMLPFVNPSMPIIALQAGAGNEITCLFDTGSPSFFSLKESDFKRLNGNESFRILAEGYGEGSIGVGGMAEADTSFRVRFPLLSVGNAKFQNVSSETSNPPYSLLGLKLLEYGKVTLDYVRKRFYFESYEAENNLAEKHYDVDLRVDNGSLIVSTVWTAMKGIVEVGDRIIEINGTPVGIYDFCESIVTGIPELSKKRKTKLTVQTCQGDRVIVYQKK